MNLLILFKSKPVGTKTFAYSFIITQLMIFKNLFAKKNLVTLKYNNKPRTPVRLIGDANEKGEQAVYHSKTLMKTVKNMNFTQLSAYFCY